MDIELPISKGMITRIDPETFDLLKKRNLLKWNAQVVGKKIYASRSFLPEGLHGKKFYKKIYLHRLIMDAPDNILVDHIDGNPLNNCRKNLRLAYHRQNSRNQIINKPVGEYKGVHKTKNSYAAQIQFNQKHYNLGHFSTAEDAARVYDLMAAICFGEFASFNFAVSSKFISIRSEVIFDSH